MELYKLNDWYRKEILMIDSKYALAREYISKIEELTNDKKFKTSSFNSTDFLNNASKILDIKKLNKMLYCSNEEKEKYLVYIHDDSLCYKINSNFKKIDSIEIFKNMFDNRTPDEDEEYLEKSGNPVPNIRRGKAKHSNIIIDTSGKIYIFPYISNTMHHTFISHGSDVIFAGTIGLENGKITYIDNSSGHYRTNFLKILAGYCYF